MVFTYRTWVHVFQDTLAIAASVVFAVYLIESGAVHELVSFFGAWSLAAALVAGAFFSSTLTVVPAAAVLGELSQSLSPVLVALAGGFGAALADMALLSLLRRHIAQDVKYLLSLAGLERLTSVHRTRLMRWLLPLLGAVIIALPLPDEIGVAFMGLSKLSRKQFFFLAFALNFLGILALGLIARDFAW